MVRVDSVVSMVNVVSVVRVISIASVLSVVNILNLRLSVMLCAEFLRWHSSSFTWSKLETARLIVVCQCMPLCLQQTSHCPECMSHLMPIVAMICPSSVTANELRICSVLLLLPTWSVLVNNYLS